MKPLLRAAVAAALPLILVVAVRAVIIQQVKSRLHEVDPVASFHGISLSADAIFLDGLSMPGKGLDADSVWITLEGLPFSPAASSVVIKGGSLVLRNGDNHEGFGSEGFDLPPVSAQDILLSDGSTMFACRRHGGDLIAIEGTWGEITVERNGDRFSGAFNDLSGFPILDSEIPWILKEHSISGFCSGTLGDSTDFSGSITGLDGNRASALFEYSCMGGAPRAAFSMDFSQVGESALDLLDSLSRGAVMTAVPAGSLTVSLSGSDSVQFSTSLSFDSVVIFSEAIAPDTFTTSAFLSCSGFALPGTGTLAVDSGLIRLGEAEANFRLTWFRGGRNRLILDAWNPSLTGEAITRSVPGELMGRLNGLSLAGEMDFFVALILDWDYPDSCDIQIDLDVSGLMVAWSPVSFSALRDSGASCTMRDSWGNSQVIGLDTLSNANFVVYDSIPFFFEPLLRCAEDASFRTHHGFSEYHIRNSIRTDMAEGRFARGGSTISMQLAKNLFLGREKTLARKLQEVFLTWRLERWLSKDRIIELYANVVELGPGVFGFNSAALYYFNKPFTELSVRETAFLVSILPGPSVYHQYGTRGELPAYWDAYVERLISICGSRGWLEQQLVSEALSDTLIFSGPVTEFGTVPRGSQSN